MSFNSQPLPNSMYRVFSTSKHFVAGFCFCWSAPICAELHMHILVLVIWSCLRNQKKIEKQTNGEKNTQIKKYIYYGKHKRWICGFVCVRSFNWNTVCCVPIYFCCRWNYVFSLIFAFAITVQYILITTMAVPSPVPRPLCTVYTRSRSFCFFNISFGLCVYYYPQNCQFFSYLFSPFSSFVVNWNNGFQIWNISRASERKKQTVFFLSKICCSAGPWITCEQEKIINEKKIDWNKIRKLCLSSFYVSHSLYRCLVLFRFNFKEGKHLFDMGFIARHFRACKTSFELCDVCFVFCSLFSVWVWSASSLRACLFLRFKVHMFLLIPTLMFIL